jgi:hypothetical protein
MTHDDIKEYISLMTDGELTEEFELYQHFDCVGSADQVRIALLEDEMFSRNIAQFD